ncbi:MAG TPA: low temperature requirement protein A [Beijerinckiaceae bacterium]|nr:low temperature requirement protein A [Beijerinckiaceae bacterium]
MTPTSQPQTFHHRRAPAEHGHHRVTFLELFFDLVFVFAVTQLSHGLIHHPTWLGLLETAILAMAVWWVWIYTSWCTNWADPDKAPVRMMLFVLMLLGLVMSMAVPKAFEGKAMVFALAYVAMQVGRSAYMLWPMAEFSPGHRRNVLRITLWFVFSGALWIGGAALGGAAQIGLWALAVAHEYAGPAARFWTPGLGASQPGEWDIEPGHFAERCGLFVIIALGESILVASSTFAGQEWRHDNAMAFLATFLGALGMWATYFNIGQERGALVMKRAENSGLVGRAYTYLHILIVAGIIGTAVSDEFVLAHASGTIDAKTLLATVGGPLLYLIGLMLFKRATAGWFPLSHIGGCALLLGLWFAAGALHPWQLALATALVLCLVAAWESWSLGPDAVTKIGAPHQRNKQT